MLTSERGGPPSPTHPPPHCSPKRVASRLGLSVCKAATGSDQEKMESIALQNSAEPGRRRVRENPLTVLPQCELRRLYVHKQHVGGQTVLWRYAETLLFVT
jgi:hypothetical protein